ncbi:MAG TPA: alpha/beta hydrolase domain-containing protein [Myxococcaceae bacterium]|nr:alpha/beta hydrolase domain-containing protein [Myxococcaceae bacterium]
MKRSLLMVGVAIQLAISGAVQARLKGFVVYTQESPTFGGYSWPGVGQYEKITGKAFGEVDPLDPKNAVIVDIQLAPRNANGNVEFSFDFYILKPIDLSRGAHKAMYEPPNRGNKLWGTLGRFPGGNDPGSITDPTALAGAFFMPRGYTLVWSGWDKAAGLSSENFNATITLPIAKNPDGSSITGPSFEYLVAGAPTPSFPLTYLAATLDQSGATLTHRIHLDDVPTVLPDSAWRYTNDKGIGIALTSGNFAANDIYEFSYMAKDPTVNTIGLAAIRDFNAWLRYETQDDFGNANPLAGDVARIYTTTVSQPARTMNDFTYFGFNQAENGMIVFDGMLQWIGAGDGLSMNYRFSQPGRTERNRQDHLFNEAVFPFANVMTMDPFTGIMDSRYARCEMTQTCPLAMEIYSSNEYWVKAASLLHTDPTGTVDLPDSPFARNYLISSHQHGTGSAMTMGACQQFQNPLNSAPVQRALFIAMDEWATQQTQPPASQVPKFSDGTLVPPMPQSGTGFPNIPGVTYTGLKTTRYRFNFGPDFYQTGIATINPPAITPPYEDNPANGPIYPSFIPKTDTDGNEIAGVRLGDVTVPLATYTGWALRSAAWANDGCEGSGQYIPFERTTADRVTRGDPRQSVEERYTSLDDYTSKVVDALNGMVGQRLLLPEDYDAELNRLIAAGQAAGLLPSQ